MAQDVKAVYTGSFDPVTLGHLDIIRRASRLFSQVIVGVGINKDKRPLFDPDQRVALVRRVTQDMPGIEVATFDGLAVDFVRHEPVSEQRQAGAGQERLSAGEDHDRWGVEPELRGIE